MSCAIVAVEVAPGSQPPPGASHRTLEVTMRSQSIRLAVAALVALLTLAPVLAWPSSTAAQEPSPGEPVPTPRPRYSLTGDRGYPGCVNTPPWDARVQPTSPRHGTWQTQAPRPRVPAGLAVSVGLRDKFGEPGGPNDRLPLKLTMIRPDDSTVVV